MNRLTALLSRLRYPQPPEEFTRDFDDLLADLWDSARDDFYRLAGDADRAAHPFRRLVRLSVQRCGHAYTAEQIAAEGLTYPGLLQGRG